jgi:hypothetical protein
MHRLTSTPTSGFESVSVLEPGTRISFQKYPGLLELVSELLTDAGKCQKSGKVEHSTVTERVFPALELIRRKISSTSSDDCILRRSVIKQIESPVWAVRDQAARVYASLLKLPEIMGEIRSLLEIDGSHYGQNHLHGRVLCIRYSLHRLLLSSYEYWRGEFALMLI